MEKESDDERFFFATKPNRYFSNSGNGNGNSLYTKESELENNKFELFEPGAP